MDFSQKNHYQNCNFQKNRESHIIYRVISENPAKMANLGSKLKFWNFSEFSLPNFSLTKFSNFLGYRLYRTGAFFSKFNNSTSSNDWNNWIYRRCSWKYRLFNATKWFLSVCYSYFYHSSYLIDPIFYGTYLLLISYESFYSIHFIILLY